MVVILVAAQYSTKPISTHTWFRTDSWMSSKWWWDTFISSQPITYPQQSDHVLYKANPFPSNSGSVIIQS